MSNYENAPATRMVATACACCARPLVDARSVETGVGPECRRRHGFGEADAPAAWLDALAALANVPAAAYQSEAFTAAVAAQDARAAANVLVYRIAAEQDGANVLAFVNALRALGFARLAARIADRVATIEITRADGRIEVATPYNPDAVIAFRAVPGRRFDRARKVETFPAEADRAVLAALRKVFAGSVAKGPKGLFRV